MPLYCPRFFGHKAALCGLVGCDRCGHPVPACFGGASITILFQEPVLVVAIEVRPARRRALPLRQLILGDAEIGEGLLPGCRSTAELTYWLPFASSMSRRS